jgi:hypothetical protein
VDGIPIIEPGAYLTVDEIMSLWRGLSAEFVADGIPHETKIARKPEGFGAEMMAVACGERGILLRIDIMEGKVTMQDNPFFAEYGAGTAVTLPLASPSVWKRENCHWRQCIRLS